MNIVIAIFTIGIIILVHELGHFWAARRCGILVEEFAMGMGPKIFSFKRGDTVYSLRLLPFGGSCRMLGEDARPAAKESEPGEDSEPNEDEPGDNLPADNRSFPSKPIWKRLIVISAGSIMNAVLAFVLLFFIFTAGGFSDVTISEIREGFPAQLAGIQEGDRVVRVDGRRILVPADISGTLRRAAEEEPGRPVEMQVVRNGRRYTYHVPAVIPGDGRFFTYELKVGLFSSIPEGVAILGVGEGFPAAAAGLRAGDRIIRINNVETHRTSDINDYLRAFISENPELPLEIEVIRGGERHVFNLTPMYSPELNRYLIGISYEDRGNIVRATFADTVRMAANYCVFLVRATFEAVGMLVTREVGVGELMGPVGIVSVIGEAYEAGRDAGIAAALLNVFSLMSLISINLSIINLLPIPMLDGGRIVFLLIEAVRRKPISPEKEGMIHFAGFVLLMILTVFIAYNDIMRLI